MTQENEAPVREAVEAYYRADTARLLELVQPDLEWTYLNPEDSDPQPQVCHGRRGEPARADGAHGPRQQPGRADLPALH
jgi:ketosteroid isomerase-like protein